MAEYQNRRNVLCTLIQPTTECVYIITDLISNFFQFKHVSLIEGNNSKICPFYFLSYQLIKK